MPEPIVADGDLVAALKGLLGPVGAAVLGLLWGRAEDLKRGHARPPLKIILLVDLPTAAGLGMTIGGISLWLGAPLVAVLALTAAGARLGTDWVLGVLLPRLLAKYLAPQGDPPAPPAPADPAPEPPKE